MSKTPDKSYGHTAPRNNLPASLDILVIDDDIDLLKIAFDMFTARGYRVALARSSFVGLSLAQRMKFDFILAEILSKEDDWLDHYLQIRRASPETTILISTGYGTSFPDVMAAQESGFDVIQKPYKISSLLCGINEH